MCTFNHPVITMLILKSFIEAKLFYILYITKILSTVRAGSKTKKRTAFTLLHKTSSTIERRKQKAHSS